MSCFDVYDKSIGHAGILEFMLKIVSITEWDDCFIRAKNILMTNFRLVCWHK